MARLPLFAPVPRAARNAPGDGCDVLDHGRSDGQHVGASGAASICRERASVFLLRGLEPGDHPGRCGPAAERLKAVGNPPGGERLRCGYWCRLGGRLEEGIPPWTSYTPS